MMRKTILSLAAVLALGAAACSLAQAQDEAGSGRGRSCPSPPPILTTEQTQAAIRAARDRGFLWRISKDGRESYLYGTFHVGNPQWMLGPTVVRALIASDHVAFELDPTDPEMLKRTGANMASGNVLLPDELAARVRAQAEFACVAAAAFATMDPELQGMTLHVLALRDFGVYLGYGSERLLAGVARTLKKPITSLETPELQINALRGRNAQESIALVEMMLTSLESGADRKVSERLLETWANSRLDDLQDYKSWCQCTRTEFGRSRWQRIIEDRNPGLVAGIAAIHESGQRVFAAVGSAHTIGPNGVVALLAQQGYQIEFVPFGSGEAQSTPTPATPPDQWPWPEAAPGALFAPNQGPLSPETPPDQWRWPQAAPGALFQPNQIPTQEHPGRNHR
jgi:uncharacterized protein YbaP (TraB family)